MGSWRVRIDSGQSHGSRLSDFLSGRPLRASLALSRASSASNRGRLAATLEWLGPRAALLAVVDASFLARWNAMAFDGESAASARDSARKEADQVRRRIDRAIASAGLGGKTTVLDWEALAGGAEGTRAAEAVEAFSRSCPAFEDEIRAEAEEYVRRTRGIPLASLPRESAALLRRYVLEEVAVLLELQRRGFPVEVYHGPELPLLRAIGGGSFPGFPFSVGERTHVAISLVREDPSAGLAATPPEAGGDVPNPPLLS